MIDPTDQQAQPLGLRRVSRPRFTTPRGSRHPPAGCVPAARTGPPTRPVPPLRGPQIHAHTIASTPLDSKHHDPSRVPTHPSPSTTPQHCDQHLRAHRPPHVPINCGTRDSAPAQGRRRRRPAAVRPVPSPHHRPTVAGSASAPTRPNEPPRPPTPAPSPSRPTASTSPHVPTARRSPSTHPGGSTPGSRATVNPCAGAHESCTRTSSSCTSSRPSATSPSPRSPPRNNGPGRLGSAVPMVPARARRRSATGCCGRSWAPPSRARARSHEPLHHQGRRQRADLRTTDRLRRRGVRVGRPRRPTVPGDRAPRRVRRSPQG